MKHVAGAALDHHVEHEAWRFNALAVENRTETDIHVLARAMVKTRVALIHTDQRHTMGRQTAALSMVLSPPSTGQIGACANLVVGGHEP